MIQIKFGKNRTNCLGGVWLLAFFTFNFIQIFYHKVALPQKFLEYLQGMVSKMHTEFCDFTTKLRKIKMADTQK